MGNRLSYANSRIFLNEIWNCRHSLAKENEAGGNDKGENEKNYCNFHLYLGSERLPSVPIEPFKGDVHFYLTHLDGVLPMFSPPFSVYSA